MSERIFTLFGEEIFPEQQIKPVSKGRAKKSKEKTEEPAEEIVANEEVVLEQVIAEVETTSIAAAQEIVANEEVVVEQVIAEVVATPIAAAQEIVAIEEVNVEQVVAEVEVTPIAVAEEIVANEEVIVEQVIAEVEATPIAAAEEIVANEEVVVEHVIAEVEATPIETIQEIPTVPETQTIISEAQELPTLQQIIDAIEITAAKPAEVKEKPKAVKEPKEPKESKEPKALTNLPAEWEGEKQYYSIGEVAALFSVRTSHIRFWTNEFKLKVRTTRKGDRLYTPEQIKEIRAIHHLVKERGFTLTGAKAKLKAQNKMDVETVDLKQSLTTLRNKLIIIKNQLVA